MMEPTMILRRMEEQLRSDYQIDLCEANTIQLHTLLKYMDGGVCLIELGPELRLLYASPGFYQMTGKAQEGCSLPCGLDQVGIHPDYRLEYEQVLRDGAEKGGVVSHIHRIQGRGGAYIWRQIRAERLCVCLPPESMLPLPAQMPYQWTGSTATIQKPPSSHLPQSPAGISAAADSFPFS